MEEKPTNKTEITGFGGGRKYATYDFLVPCSIGEYFGVDQADVCYKIYSIEWEVTPTCIKKIVWLDDCDFTSQT